MCLRIPELLPLSVCEAQPARAVSGGTGRESRTFVSSVCLPVPLCVHMRVHVSVCDSVHPICGGLMWWMVTGRGCEVCEGAGVGRMVGKGRGKSALPSVRVCVCGCLVQEQFITDRLMEYCRLEGSCFLFHPRLWLFLSSPDRCHPTSRR